VDTSSDWLVVLGSGCKDCTNEETYSPQQSSTYREVSEEFIDVQYGSATV